MTDLPTADEPDGEEPTEDPAGASHVIRYRGADGEWHVLKAEPKRTGDPDLDKIWAMSFGELEEILEDESHPLHEKAKQVAAEIVRPITEAAANVLRPTMERLARTLDVSRLLPKIDTSSWLSRIAPDLGTIEAPAVTLGAPQTTPRHSIDFDAIEPPDASMAEILEASEARAHDMRAKQVEVLTDLLAETRATAEGSKVAARVATVVAVVGLVVSVVFGVLTLVASR